MALTLDSSPSGDVSPPRRSIAKLIAEITVGLAGVALVVGALAANQQWLDGHFLPSFFLPPRWYVRIETSVRVVLGLLGVWIAVFTRARAGHIAARAPARALHVTIAALLALCASELVLRTVHLRPAEWLVPDEEPRRQPDPRLGWTLVPARTGHNSIGGRVIEYAIDAAGYRVRSVGQPVDPERPTIVFTGESVMFGEGLTWEESIPAQVESITATQSANLAVHGYGNDQSYGRLQAELPRFRQPVAVVTLFMTALFGRNLDADRPHLTPGLIWLPAEQRSRVGALAKLLVPYRRTATVERGVTMTREVLHATIDLARARGATPLIVVPQFAPEAPSEQHLRHRVLDQGGVPYLLVEIHSDWRLSWDRHPNARAARIIAEAVAARLRGR
jgi:hypothetical protein